MKSPSFQENLKYLQGIKERHEDYKKVVEISEQIICCFEVQPKLSLTNDIYLPVYTDSPKIYMQWTYYTKKGYRIRTAFCISEKRGRIRDSYGQNILVDIRDIKTKPVEFYRKHVHAPISEFDSQNEKQQKALKNRYLRKQKCCYDDVDELKKANFTFSKEPLIGVLEKALEPADEIQVADNEIILKWNYEKQSKFIDKTTETATYSYVLKYCCSERYLHNVDISCETEYCDRYYYDDEVYSDPEYSCQKCEWYRPNGVLYGEMFLEKWANNRLIYSELCEFGDYGKGVVSKLNQALDTRLQDLA